MDMVSTMRQQINMLDEMDKIVEKYRNGENLPEKISVKDIAILDEYIASVKAPWGILLELAIDDKKKADKAKKKAQEAQEKKKADKAKKKAQEAQEKKEAEKPVVEADDDFLDDFLED